MKAAVLEEICDNLENDLNVYCKWSDDNELVIEKQLPYLCLYRFSTTPDENFVEIVKSQPAYLIAQQGPKIEKIIFALANTISSKLNAFMIFEMWPGDTRSKTFKIFCPQGAIPATIESLQDSLSAFEANNSETRVQLISEGIGNPSGITPIANTVDAALERGFMPVALEVPPYYKKKNTTLPADVYFHGLKSMLSDAVKRAVFEFMRVQTPIKFNHHLMLGKTEIREEALAIDKHLTALSNRMNFLLLVSPLNTHRQWEIFKKSEFEASPNFSYRFIHINPEVEKKELYSLPMSKVVDPALSFILREKRLELDKQLNMLEERGSKRFQYMSQDVYGVPSKRLVKVARQILKNLEPPKRTNTQKLDCHGFAALAQKEVDAFREKFQEQQLTIEIRSDISSLMVSKNKLLIGEKVNISKRRASALIQHEVGTHMLTFCNGQRQPLQQLAGGFAGYDDLQEGLAVLAEHLTGGLTLPRLRTLAARVLAVDALVNGAEFMEIFNLLTEKYEVKPRLAFLITARVVRGGGFTKDAVYLSGLIQLQDYLEGAGELEVLFTGKFSFRHIPLIRELLHREILEQPFLPTYLDEKAAQERLNKLRLKINLEDLIN